MDRRKFLSTLIGGVAATAAVRTFPFRVYSFPTEIKAVTYEDILEIKVPHSVAIWASLIGGPFRFIEEMSLAEAKARYGYEWKPGYSKTQQAQHDHRLYCAPFAASTTGVIG